MHLLVKAVADNQANGEIKIQEEVATQEPTPSSVAIEDDVGELQGEDAATQEPASPEVVSEAPTKVEITIGEFQGEDVVTQELASPEVV